MLAGAGDRPRGRRSHAFPVCPRRLGVFLPDDRLQPRGPSRESTSASLISAVGAGAARAGAGGDARASLLRVEARQARLDPGGVRSARRDPLCARRRDAGPVLVAAVGRGCGGVAVRPARVGRVWDRRLAAVAELRRCPLVGCRAAGDSRHLRTPSATRAGGGGGGVARMRAIFETLALIPRRSPWASPSSGRWARDPRLAIAPKVSAWGGGTGRVGEGGRGRVHVWSTVLVAATSRGQSLGGSG